MPVRETEPEPSRDDVLLGRRLGRIWDVLADADPGVTVQDALAVLADLELRPTRATPPAGAAAPSLAAGARRAGRSRPVVTATSRPTGCGTRWSGAGCCGW